MLRLHNHRVYEGPDGSIVFDGETLSLMEADEVSLEHLERASHFSDLTNLDAEAMSCLVEAGLISTDEELDVEDLPPSICAFRMVMAETCNFGCPGCFVLNHTGSLRQINDETVCRVVNQAVQLSNGGDFTFHFFGGEPLLRFKQIVLAVEMAEEAKDRGLIKPIYALTTNLSLLDEQKAAFFLKHGFRVGVSVDGPPEINDIYRRYPNGRGTYDKVRRQFEILERLGVNRFILITPHGPHLDQLPDIFDQVVSDFNADTVTINTPFADGSFGWEVDGNRYAETLVAIHVEARTRGVDIDSALSPPLGALSSGVRRLSSCSITGNSTMISIDPDGGASPCPQCWTKTVPLAEVSRCFELLPNEQLPSCDQCIVRNICGGSCRLFRALSGRSHDIQRCAFMQSVPRLVAKHINKFTQEE